MVYGDTHGRRTQLDDSSGTVAAGLSAAMRRLPIGANAEQIHEQR